MNQHYQLLPKLSLPIFNKDFQMTDTPFGHNALDISNVSNELLEMFKERNLELAHFGTFRWGPNVVTPIHTDNKPRGPVHDTIKLNWVFGGTNSRVNWYESIDKSILAQEYISPAKSTLEGGRSFEYYTHHDPSNCRLLESAELKGTLLMQAGIPHNVVNADEERFCFSAVLISAITKEHLSMKDGLEIFADFI